MSADNRIIPGRKCSIDELISFLGKDNSLLTKLKQDERAKLFDLLINAPEGTQVGISYRDGKEYVTVRGEVECRAAPEDPNMPTGIKLRTSDGEALIIPYNAFHDYVH